MYDASDRNQINWKLKFFSQISILRSVKGPIHMVTHALSLSYTESRTRTHTQRLRQTHTFPTVFSPFILWYYIAACFEGE